MQPRDQMSIAVEYSRSPRRISGARYHRVTTSTVSGRTGHRKDRDRPKSAIFRMPRELSTSTFCGLRSR
eukprot:scaffold707_cov240-Pinguiococcus_pyrenoidosus.AAC.9